MKVDWNFIKNLSEDIYDYWCFYLAKQQEYLNSQNLLCYNCAQNLL
jgi:hypothetical protein